MSDLKNRVLKKMKQELIEQISLIHISADEIKNEEPIFGDQGKLNMDSLDAIELVMLLERNFDIKLKQSRSSTLIFKSFDSLGDYIIEKASPEKVAAYVESI